MNIFNKLKFNFGHKTPVILQVEASECGLASLAMIMGYYKNYIDLTTFRRKESISIKGATLQNVIDIANRNNLSTRPLRLELDELDKLKTPCILHWSLNHFVVLVSVKSNGIIINDPARGQRKVNWDEVNKEFTGIALEVTPNEHFERKDERNNLKLRDLFRKTEGLKVTLSYLFCASLGLEAIAIVMPMASQVIIDEVIVTMDNSLLTTIAVGVGILIMLILYGKWLAIVTFIAVILDVISRVVAYRPYKQASEEGIVYSAKKDSHFIETLRGMASIKLLGLEESRRVKWLNLLIDSINIGLRTKRFDLIFGRINDFIFSADRLIMLVLGAYYVMDNIMSVGMLVAFLSYKDQFTGRVGSLVGAVFKLKMLSIQSDRISDIVLNPTEKELIGSQKKANTQQAIASALISPESNDFFHLSCYNLGFRYSINEDWIFRNININIPKGNSVAIVGESGCGKTTLIKAMMGLTFPEEGEILFSGQNIIKNSLNDYRHNIAGVLQDDGLFSGSIAENISGFNDKIDYDLVIKCAKDAAIFEDIQKMPMQFETFVGDMGSSLSGGQKQRVILARALYCKPEILFLDEATSSLDERTELHIANVLNNLKITRVIIAHRPATVKNCDYIIVMDKQANKEGKIQIIKREDLLKDHLNKMD